MTRQLAIGLAGMLLLCLVTYLALEMPWRYRVTAPELLPAPTIDRHLAQWDVSPFGVSVDATARDTVVRLAPADGNGTAYIDRPFFLPDGLDHVRFGLEVRAEDLITGYQPWEKARAFVWSFDQELRLIWYWPKDLANLEGDRAWRRYSAVIPLDDRVRAMRLIAYNGAHSGSLALRNLQVEGLAEKPLFTAIRHVLVVVWVLSLVAVAVAIARASPPLWLKAACLAMGLLTLIAVAMPQPYHGEVTQRVEAWVRIVSDPGVLAAVMRDLVGRPAQDVDAAAETEPEAEPSEGQNGPEAEGPDAAGTDEADAPDDAVETPPRGEDSVDLGSQADLQEQELQERAPARYRLSIWDVGHATSFFLLSLLVCTAFMTAPLPLLALCLGLSVLASESLQLMIITRSSESIDVIADTVGVVLALGLSAMIRFGRALRAA
ncbi:MAG: VanZ family protein [Kiloniellales bacterium]|nr:VanZ family protein [Kiloniellales bacterium]